MAINPSDISCVLSGGTYNNDPYLSLGGEPSLRAIFGVTNNLFDDVTSDEALVGHVDYRCLYVVNNHATDSFYNTQLYIESQTTGGSNIEIGVPMETDVQQIIVSGLAQGGSFTIDYDGQTVIVAFNLFLEQWATNIQNGLNAIPELGGVVVDVSSYSNGGSVWDLTRVFEIRFEGVSDHRYHPTLTLVSNDIIAPTPPTIQIVKITNGCPINVVAAQIDTDQIEPYGITWSEPDVDNTLVVGTIQAGDSFPVWLKRTTLAGTDPINSDGFILRILGKPFA